MHLTGVRYYGADFCFHYGDVHIRDGRVTELTRRQGPPPGDALLVLPGLIDLHVHGNSGLDFSCGAAEETDRMLRFLARQGTLACCPTTMALPEETLTRACRALANARPELGARVAGIHLEGPFFHPDKKGAQAPEHLRLPDVALVKRLQAAAEGRVRILSFAPELPGAMEMIDALRGQLVLSAAHTTADYDTAAAAIRGGVTHVTHLYNAMPPLLHRAPGLIGAAAEAPQVTAELICDGIHIHPAAVRAAFALFGRERMCLISDAMAACGMPDGIYALGGQRVQVTGGRAVLADGTLAGSAATLYQCVCRAVDFGIPLEDALRAATWNPAQVLGLEAEIGCIAVGRRADLLVCQPDLTLRRVLLAGEPLA